MSHLHGDESGSDYARFIFPREKKQFDQSNARENRIGNKNITTEIAFKYREYLPKNHEGLECRAVYFSQSECAYGVTHGG